jgi:hypothetical protein
MAKIRLLGQPQGTWVGLETLKVPSRYMDQLWNTWVSLKVFRSAMEHLGQPLMYLDQLWNTLVSLKVFKLAVVLRSHGVFQG